MKNFKKIAVLAIMLTLLCKSNAQTEPVDRELELYKEFLLCRVEAEHTFKKDSLEREHFRKKMLSDVDTLRIGIELLSLQAEIDHSKRIKKTDQTSKEELILMVDRAKTREFLAVSNDKVRAADARTERYRAQENQYAISAQNEGRKMTLLSDILPSPDKVKRTRGYNRSEITWGRVANGEARLKKTEQRAERKANRKYGRKDKTKDKTFEVEYQSTKTEQKPTSTEVGLDGQSRTLGPTRTLGPIFNGGTARVSTTENNNRRFFYGRPAIIRNGCWVWEY